MVVGGLLTVAGHVMAITLLAFRLHGKYGRDLYLAAGTLYAVANAVAVIAYLFFTFTDLGIAPVLLYLLGDILMLLALT